MKCYWVGFSLLWLARSLRAGQDKAAFHQRCLEPQFSFTEVQPLWIVGHRLCHRLCQPNTVPPRQMREQRSSGGHRPYRHHGTPSRVETPRAVPPSGAALSSSYRSRTGIIRASGKTADLVWTHALNLRCFKINSTQSWAEIQLFY